MRKILIFTLLFFISLFANEIKLKDDKEIIHSLQKSIYFSRGAKKTNSHQEKRLEKHAKFMLETDGVNLLLKGYTDNSGKRELDNWIALDYAKACKESLIKKGVEASRITITTYGASKSKEKGAKDRRVEFVYFY